DPKALPPRPGLLARLAPATADAASLPLPAPARPCSGPGCSQAPAAPIPAPAVSLPLRVDSWACLAMTAEPPGVSGRWFLHYREPARPLLVGPSIDRPPRLSSLHAA